MKMKMKMGKKVEGVRKREKEMKDTSRTRKGKRKGT